MADEKQLQNHLLTPKGKPRLHLSLLCFSSPVLRATIEPSFCSAVGKGHPRPDSQATSQSPQPGLEGWHTVCKGVMVEGEGVYCIKVPPAKTDCLFMLVRPSSWAFTHCSHHLGLALLQHCPTNLAEGVSTGGTEHWHWVPRVLAWVGHFPPFS